VIHTSHATGPISQGMQLHIESEYGAPIQQVPPCRSPTRTGPEGLQHDLCACRGSREPKFVSDLSNLPAVAERNTYAMGKRTQMGRAFDRGEPPLPPVDQPRRSDRHLPVLRWKDTDVKADGMVGSQNFPTFVKNSAPQRPRQVVIPVFRDMIDKEFHRDQIEGLGPPLIKLMQKQK
jgi:hypothetical protein